MPRCCVCDRESVRSWGSMCGRCKAACRWLSAVHKPAPKPAGKGWRGPRAVVVRE